MEVFVARHAIFDKSLSLFGYELLFRSAQRDSADVLDDTASTLQVLANALLSSGLDTLSSNTPAFVNFGRELLTSDWTSLLPPSAVVVEILESVDPDPQVIEACHNLQKQGYRLALDDVTGTAEEKGPLLDLVNFVKVDFRATSRDEQMRLATLLRPRGRKLLAEKVETYQEFVWACEAGYDYFQGFFFARPALLRGHHIPGTKIDALRLLRELRHPELDFDRLEEMIRCDISLTYKLFRYVNSALFARRHELRSIKEALLVLGESGIRRWITLATLPALAAGTAHELMVHALVRARFCELLADAAHSRPSSDAFLAGLFSLLDALVDRPLLEILPELSLPEHINRVLLGTALNSPLAAVYRTVLAYERGEWESLDALIQTLKIPHSLVSDFYLQAISWAREMLNLVGPDTSKNAPAPAAARREPVLSR